jgi:signal transduction histidine kinase
MQLTTKLRLRRCAAMSPQSPDAQLRHEDGAVRPGHSATPLPIAPSEDVSASTDPFVISQLARMEATSLTKLLVVATDGATRGRVDQRLEGEYEVVRSRSFDEAVTLLRQERFALVLLDVREPGRPVEELARELRLLDGEMSVIALGAGKAVRVIGEQCVQVPFDAPDILELTRQQVEVAMRRRGRSGVMREMEGIIALLQKELEAKDTLAAHGEASASMVHDLKNALFSTLGYTARLIQETAQLKDAVGDQAQPIDAIAKKLEHTSNYLMHLAHTCRFNDGTSGVKERLDLHAEIEHVHAVLFFHSPNLHITPRPIPEDGDAPQPAAIVLGDRYELHRIFQNLFKNAFEAGAENVLVNVRVNADRIAVTIADNGRGFDNGDVAVALSRPLRSSKRGGQGLGLRICRQIIERHGGTISLTSEPGRGAVFTLSFPLAGSV